MSYIVQILKFHFFIPEVKFARRIGGGGSVLIIVFCLSCEAAEIARLIDCVVFYAVLAVFQPYNSVFFFNIQVKAREITPTMSHYERNSLG